MGYAEHPAQYRWTRHEYERLISHAFLDEDDPVELLDGLLLVKEPQDSPHRTAVLLVARALDRAFGEGWLVQTQSPIILDDRLRAGAGRLRRPWLAARLRAGASGAAGAGRRGRPVGSAPGARTEGDSLCPRSDRRLLDRQPGRSRARSAPRAGATRPRAATLDVCVDRASRRGGHDHPARRSSRDYPRRRSLAVARAGRAPEARPVPVAASSARGSPSRRTRRAGTAAGRPRTPPPAGWPRPCRTSPG